MKTRTTLRLYFGAAPEVVARLGRPCGEPRGLGDRLVVQLLSGERLLGRLGAQVRGPSAVRAMPARSTFPFEKELDADRDRGEVADLRSSLK